MAKDSEPSHICSTMSTCVCVSVCVHVCVYVCKRVSKELLALLTILVHQPCSSSVQTGHGIRCCFIRLHNCRGSAFQMADSITGIRNSLFQPERSHPHKGHTEGN